MALADAGAGGRILLWKDSFQLRREKYITLPLFMSRVQIVFLLYVFLAVYVGGAEPPERRSEDLRPEEGGCRMLLLSIIC